MIATCWCMWRQIYYGRLESLSSPADVWLFVVVGWWWRRFYTSFCSHHNNKRTPHHARWLWGGDSGLRGGWLARLVRIIHFRTGEWGQRVKWWLPFAGLDCFHCRKNGCSWVSEAREEVAPLKTCVKCNSFLHLVHIRCVMLRDRGVNFISVCICVYLILSLLDFTFILFGI